MIRVATWIVAIACVALTLFGLTMFACSLRKPRRWGAPRAHHRRADRIERGPHTHQRIVPLPLPPAKTTTSGPIWEYVAMGPLLDTPLHYSAEDDEPNFPVVRKTTKPATLPE